MLQLSFGSRSCRGRGCCCSCSVVPCLPAEQSWSSEALRRPGLIPNSQCDHQQRHRDRKPRADTCPAYWATACVKTGCTRREVRNADVASWVSVCVRVCSMNWVKVYRACRAKNPFDTHTHRRANSRGLLGGVCVWVLGK